MSVPERAAVEAHTTSVAVHLTLQLGYFKTTWQLFSYEQDAVSDDLRYIRTRYFPGKALADIQQPSRPTRLALQQIVLKLFDYHMCDSAAKDALERKAQRHARLSTQPLYLLREALHHLTTQRIVAPPYTFLQEMVGRVVTRERTRITQRLGHALTPTVATPLDALLEADEHLYRISALKHAAKDFRDQELRQEVTRRQFFHPRYAVAHTFLATAGLSNESSKYYASLVKCYTVSKLQRMARATARLSLFCFAYYRFRQISDHLVKAFIHLVDQYEQQAKQAAEDAMQRAVTEAGEHLQAAGQVLSLFVEASIPGEAPFTVVQEQAFALLDPARFPLVTDYLRNIGFDKMGLEWSAYTTLSPTFKRNLRHLFAELDFAGRVEDAPVLEAVACLQGLLRRGQSPRQTNPSGFPTTVIPQSVQRSLFTKEAGQVRALDVDRYEFLVYRLLRNALEAGHVFVRESTEFRRFGDDLISDARWQHQEAV